MGDDTKETKKSKKKPKSRKKKTWSREEILNTFLPPEKQQALQKSKQHRSKTAISESEKQSAKKPAKRPAKKEKKPVPQVVIKEKKEAENPAEADGVLTMVYVTSSQELDHSIHDAVGPHGSQTEVGRESSWLRDLMP